MERMETAFAACHPAGLVPLAALPAAAAAPLQENARPVACGAEATGGPGIDGSPGAVPAGHHAKLLEALASGLVHTACKGTAVREFGTPVDGSPVGRGHTDQLLGGMPASSPQQLRGCQPGGFALERLGGLDQRRKRQADSSVYVDEEFRDERPHTRPALQSTSAAASSSSGSRAPMAPLDGPARWDPQPSPPAPGGSWEESGEGMDVDLEPEGKENGPGSSDLARAAAAVDHARALRDLVLEVPQECEDHPFSDVESSSGDSDFQSENLAGRLEERVRDNADGRYVFEVFVDPENCR